MSWNLDALAWGIIQKKTKIMDYLTSNFPLAHVDRANRHRRPQDGTKTGLSNYPCVDLAICHIPNPVQATVHHRDSWNPKALSEWHQNGIRFEPTSGRDIEMMLLYPYILLEFQKRITPE